MVEINKTNPEPDFRDPPQAAKFVNRRGDLHIRVTEQNQNIFEEEFGLDDLQSGDRVTFSEGEELPPELVTPSLWAAFSDTLEGRDSENKIISKVDYQQ